MAGAWAWLVFAALLEIAWASGLKYTAGLRKLWPTVAVLIAYNAGLVALAFAVEKLPVGTAYAVWVGIGIVGVVVFGAMFLKEPLTWSRMLFIGLIAVGVVGLNLTHG